MIAGIEPGGLIVIVLIGSLLTMVDASLPSFDEDSRMRILLLPFSTRPGATIYRVRASDPDFEHPLEFSFMSKSNPGLLLLEPIPCGKQHSVCEANVVLNESVELDRIYELSLSVRDTSGGVTTVFCTIQITNMSAPLTDTFQHLNQYITVPENMPRETVVDYLIAWKNPSNVRGIRMELKSNLNSIRHFRLSDKLAGSNRTNCSIILERSLDFEVQTVHILRILALNAYVDSRIDTRNVVEVTIYIFVQDVQDTPPIFVSLPSVTIISDKLEVDKVVLKVKADDGDKGSPREVGYALLADGSPFAPFFSMDPTTGLLKVRKSLSGLNQMLRSRAPFLLTIIAEEMGTLPGESNTSSAADVAIIVEDETNDPPQFNQDRYVAHLIENAPVGTALHFGDGQNPQVTDSDQGPNGIFSLSLIGDNSTFEISPSVAENMATFTIRVKNPALIDYEKTQQIRFKVIAEEVQQGSNRLSSADVIVYLTDDNDHSPVFEKESYSADIPENSAPGTAVVQVKATDIDTGTMGSIRYTQILGTYAKSFQLDPISGVIIVGSKSSLDRETSPEITLTVEAKDMDGTGRSTTVPLVIRLLDVNDNAPQFINLPYETSLTPDLSRLTSKIIVQAIDNDTNANGALRYEIVRGNFESKFKMNEISGELTLAAPLTSTNLPSLIQLQVRAYDLGVPHLHSETVVQVYTQEVTARSIHFIVPRRIDEDGTKRMESLLMLLTGAPTVINTIQPYSEDMESAALIEKSDDPEQKSRLIATVKFPPHASVVDVERIQRAIVTNEFDLYAGVTIEQEYRNRNLILVWTLVTLILLFAIITIILAICCCCPGCYCYSERKTKNRYAGTIRPVMVVDGRSGNVSQLTTPGRKEAWSGNKRISRNNRRQTRDRLINVTEIDTSSNKRAPNGDHYYDHSRRNHHHPFDHDPAESEFHEIQPEDSASHQGGPVSGPENSFYYQRMGNADVMRFDHRRRSNSEPKLNEDPPSTSLMESGSKSMINYPNNHRLDDQYRMALAEPQHGRASQSKYVQSPILEETDSALERELHQTGSNYFLRPKGGGYLEYHQPGSRFAWQRSSSVPPESSGGSHHHHHRRNSAEMRELKELEREFPYFNNRSSFLRHRLSKIRKSSNPNKDSSKKGGRMNGDGYDTESGGSSNERDNHTTRRNSISSSFHNKLSNNIKPLDDDRDSGIALNNNGTQQRSSRFLEKKSIFTIAYDDVATTKIPSSSDLPPT